MDERAVTNAAQAAEQNEPERKRVKRCEPDLRVLIEKDVVHWCHSVIMASHSNYIARMLATPMKESQTYELSFPDITPTTWEAMMTFLEDPEKAFLMTVDDVMVVAEYYDKYDFTKGRRLCNRVLVEYFKNSAKEEPPDLHKIVDAIVLADKVHFEEAKEEGMKYLREKLSSTDTPYGRTMFTEAQMKKLAPLLLHDFKFLSSSVWKKEDILNPDFPRLFVHVCSAWITDKMLHNAISFIKLSGTGCKADGFFEEENIHFNWIWSSERIDTWNGIRVMFSIRKQLDDWAIVMNSVDEDGEPDDNIVDTVCWTNPCSENLPLPPRDNWKPVDPLARGNPKIEYTFI